MAFITVGDINQYLGTNKLEVAGLTGTVDELAATQKEYVFSKLYSVYSDAMDDWTDETTTPALVRAVIGMRVAGYIYIRQYAEEASTWASYGQYLLRESEKWLDDILRGALDIAEEDFPTVSSIEFYPTDLSTEAVLVGGDDLDVYPLRHTAESPRYFEMKERF